MPREHAQIRLDIWNDDDFRKLDGVAQHLYMMLLTSPSLSYCGVADWRPGRIAAMVSDWTADTVVDAAARLVQRLFIVCDYDSEEVLVRSFVKHDGIMRNWKMATAMATAAAGVASPSIRGVIVHTLQRLKVAEPDLSGWASKTAVAMLDRESIAPESLLTSCDKPVVKPIDMPVGNAIDIPVQNTDRLGSRTPIPTPDGKGSGSYHSHSTPTPTTSNEVVQREAPQKRGARLPEGWMPPQQAIEWAKANHPDVDLKSTHQMFVDHWTAESGAKASKLDWTAAWRVWIGRESKYDKTHRPPANGPGKATEAVNAWMTGQIDDQLSLKELS